MSRILKGAGGTIQATFYVDEQDTDSSIDVTIEVLRDNGDILVAAGTETNAGAAADGTYEFTLTPADASRVDLLTARWTAVIGGEPMTLDTDVEIVGGHYFTLAAARASDSALEDTAKFTTANIEEARDQVEDECEDITKVAWVPRYRRVELSGDGTRTLVVPDPRVRSIISFEVDGVAWDEDAIAGIALGDWGVLRLRGSGDRFPCGAGNIVVAYEHGYSAPKADLRRAALIRIRNVLFDNKSGIPDRATSYVPATGGGTFGIATAGKGSGESRSWTGIPEVDSHVNRRVHVRPVFA